MGNKQAKPIDLSDMCIDMRMASKSFAKEANKSLSKSNQERTKVANAIKSGKNEIAQIHAEGVIRNQRSAVNMMRLSAQMDAVASQLQLADRNKEVSETMQRCLPSIQGALKHLDAINISQSMEEFNKLFEDLGVRGATMGESLEQVASGAVGQTEVDTLMNQVAEENNLVIKGQLEPAGTERLGEKERAEAQQKKNYDEIQKRLDALKQ